MRCKVTKVGLLIKKSKLIVDRLFFLLNLVSVLLLTFLKKFCWSARHLVADAMQTGSCKVWREATGLKPCRMDRSLIVKSELEGALRKVCKWNELDVL